MSFILPGMLGASHRPINAAITPATDDNSVFFDGSGAYILVPDAAALSFGDGSTDTPFSVSLWVKFHDNVGDRFLITKRGSTTNKEYQFKTQSDGFSFGLFDQSTSGNISAVASGITFDTGTWYHLIGTYDGSGLASGINLYMNGLAQSVTPNTIGTYTAMENLGADLFIGKSFDTAGNLFGHLSQTVFWNLELTSYAANSLYNNGVPSDPTVNGGEYYGASYVVEYWDMEDSASTTVTALNGNNGTLTSGAVFDIDTPVVAVPTWASTDSVDFDGTNDYLRVPTPTGLTFGNSSTDQPFSISAWVKMDSALSLQRFIAKENGTSPEFVFGTSGTNKFFIGLYDNGTTDRLVAEAANSLSAATWYHVVITYDGTGVFGGLSMYVNGSAASMSDISGGSYVAMHDLGSDIYFGAWPTTGKYLDGKIAEVCFWDVELSSGNATSLYNSGSPIDSSTVSSENVVVHYPMENEGSNYTALDYSGNGQHGILTNGAAWAVDVP
jgi:hypothetical protein